MRTMDDVEDFLTALEKTPYSTVEDKKLASSAKDALCVMRDFHDYLDGIAKSSVSDVGNQGVGVAQDILDVYENGREVNVNLTLIVRGSSATITAPDGHVVHLSREEADRILGDGEGE